MSEQLKLSAGDTGTDVSNIDEFYTSRINWLITIGRPDLIDEIAEDCERRRAAPQPADSGGRGAQATTTRSRPHRWPIPGRRRRDRDLADDNAVSQPCGRRNVAYSPSAAVRIPHAVRPASHSHAGTGAAGAPPGPVETGTRLAVAKLRRSLRPRTPTGPKADK